MKHRNARIALGASALAMALLVTGCSGGSKAKKIDLAAVSEQMVAATEFEGELIKASDNVVEKRYDLSQVESAVVYLEPTGGLAEEIALFEAKDGKAADVKAMLENHVESQHERFVNYVPAEIFKIDNAIYLEKGNYVGLIIAKDGTDAEAAFDKAFE